MFRKLCVFSTYEAAGMVASLLRTNGFHPVDVEQSPHAFLAGADQFYFVQLPESEIETGRKFLIAEGYEKHLIDPRR